MVIQNFTRDYLEKEGFKGFLSIKHLKDTNCKDVPKERGVYVVMSPSTPVNFIEESVGGHFKGENPTFSKQKLKDKWIPDCPIIYIGQAGGNNSLETLQKRLNRYMKFGNGELVSHWGGRYIWQIKNIDDCLICWKNLLNENPSIVESKLINEFKEKYKYLPFANLKKPHLLFNN